MKVIDKIKWTEAHLKKYSKVFNSFSIACLKYVKKLNNLENKEIGISEIVSTLKDIFRGTSFTEKTWRTYAKYLISWFQFANIDLQGRLVGLKKGRYGVTGELQQFSNQDTFTPQQRPKKDIDVFCKLIDQSKIDNFKRLYKSFYDLKSIGLITYYGNKVYLTEKGELILKIIGKKEFEKLIAIEALKAKKVKQSAKYFFEHPKCTRKELGEALSASFSNIKSEIYKKHVNNVLYAWAKFIYDNLDNANWIR